MERVELREREGKSLVFLDFSGLEPEELEDVLKEAAGVIRSRPLKSLYTLTKVDGAHFNGEVIELLKEFAKGNDPYVKMGAIVGLGGTAETGAHRGVEILGEELHRLRRRRRGRKPPPLLLTGVPAPRRVRRFFRVRGGVP